VLGLVAGPLAYYAGARLGAVELSHPLRDLALLAAAWTCILPGLVRLAERCDGYALRPHWSGR
jgi:hypothetical protein